jgi:hypothetical protein
MYLYIHYATDATFQYATRFLLKMSAFVALEHEVCEVD